ncbi:hypothetical protein AJ85_18220 [Alkalihalobacillus alcalophilus ATCC 27647 = CGMCC 1.3604]|uniref:Uncharacterized protein n=1 Tax=Alkalihalobacillus alcalophilus ATCC 27647 = CGMCC 1.3604 TaxID=1218173 RepID=A0A094WKW6_ALKAL|nr:hypothetical protein [Alkalihalobacillus alcalophilus]KGA96588.1 hypothetical protein BALCAV_0215290 [Alkalihalobacillus alcalophilus ATCC 27647 = CGMCC 1.3604]MED1563776.1 hypothetical protein [Alkalihalobacillus alcalophilus]THG89343.1 hypothetical protein AJ85_18220 [Alkalihalobacillus alcalophilus ATCC 27647 = CGMCC 1.3604]
MANNHINHRCNHEYNHHRLSEPFHCPACIPITEYDHDLFCTPFACPARLPSPRYSSPTTSLTAEDYEELISCIEVINQLLLALANESDEENQLELRQHLRKILDAFVSVSVKCGDQELKIKGLLKDVGKNFILITDFDKRTFIPFTNICFIQHDSNQKRHETAHEGHRHTLIDIDTCMRRQLVLHFGEYVSQKPYLLNLFFGLSLELYLLQFIECPVHVVKRMSEESHAINEDEIRGILVDAKDGQLYLKQKEQLELVNVEDICYIKMR